MADDSDPVTLKQKEEERDIEEHLAGHLEGQPALESTARLIQRELEEEAADLKTILKATPEDIQRQVGETRGRVRDIVVEGADATVSSVIGDFEAIADVDLSALDNTALLETIAQANISQFQLLSVIANIEVNQLQALFDILTAVEPFTSITVSGVNDIEEDEEGEAIPVVPQSDTTAIPTRILFIKASANNADQMAFGDDEVDPDDGFILSPGESKVLSINLSNQVLWMAGDTEGDSVELLGLT